MVQRELLYLTVCVPVLLCVTGVCKAGGHGKEAGAPAPNPSVHSHGHAEDEIPLRNGRDLHPPGCFEAEKAAKLTLQVICLKLYVFFMVSLSSMCHCSEMS